MTACRGKPASGTSPQVGPPLPEVPTGVYVEVRGATGTSGGFGCERMKAALERSDRVAATAPDPSTLDDLKTEHGDGNLGLSWR